MNPRSIGQIRAALLLLCAAAVVTLYSIKGHTQSAPLEELSAFPQTALTVSGQGTTHAFRIWVADTPGREEQGLMFVRELPADRGMVFVGEHPRVWTMWMKNTFIPLDMLFVAVDGHIIKIAHALPHDESIISSDVPVNGVIELQAGISDKLHMKVGDVAKWKAPPTTASSPPG